MAMCPCSSRGDAFQVAHRQILGQAFGHHDHAELLAFGFLADAHRGDDPLDHFVDVHDRRALLFRRSSGSTDFFGRRDTCRSMSSTLITRLASPAIAAP